MSATEEIESIVDDRTRFGRALLIVGALGVAGALVVGVTGWILAGRASRTITTTIEPLSGIVVNVAETIGASEVMVSRTTEAIDSIESATRSTARTLDSVSQVVEEVGMLVTEDFADSLESAVDTLPGLIDTSRVIDRTMRALSLIGVDYDPDQPLDESLSDLEASLRPLPEQLRDQAELITVVQDDLEQIATDAGRLAAVLLEARIDMMEAQRILASAASNAEAAVESVTAVEEDIETYETLARVVVTAVTVALLAAASAPLLIGFHYLRDDH